MLGSPLCFTVRKSGNTPLRHMNHFGGPRGRVVKVADFIIALDHSIISPL